MHVTYLHRLVEEVKLLIPLLPVGVTLCVILGPIRCGPELLGRLDYCVTDDAEKHVPLDMNDRPISLEHHKAKFL